MKQYTLLYIMDDTKVVHNKTFLQLKDLKDFKNYQLELKEDLQQVDKDGYVWFVENNLE